MMKRLLICTILIIGVTVTGCTKENIGSKLLTPATKTEEQSGNDSAINTAGSEATDNETQNNSGTADITAGTTNTDKTVSTQDETADRTESGQSGTTEAQDETAGQTEKNTEEQKESADDTSKYAFVKATDINTFCGGESYPSLTVTGGLTSYVKVGKEYSDKGATAKDSEDGDISDCIITKSNVNTEKAGTYTVSYSVTDADGNTTTASRTVYVYTKLIFFTYDDGPSKNTEALLNLLDEYNIKATFFVTGNNRTYRNMIAEEAARGHRVAAHTFSHDYATVYSNAVAYYKDLEQIQQIIEEQTGKRTEFIRFPGGSSNGVSKNYCEGIMTYLSEDVVNNGYIYYDWNVSSGDGNASTTTKQVLKNVKKGIESHDICVVLQHDTNAKSMAAVEDIFKYVTEKGYTCLSIDENAPVIVHGHKNN